MNLIHDLLDYNQIQRGNFKIDKTYFDLHGFLKDLMFVIKIPS